MNILDTWWIMGVLYIALIVASQQMLKRITVASRDITATVILLQFIAAAASCIFIPLFDFKLPAKPLPYLILFVTSIFLGAADVLIGFSLKHLTVSTHTIISQTGIVFIIVIGVLFLRDVPGWQAVFGVALILAANVIALYRKKDFVWNAFWLVNVLARLLIAIGISMDIGNSDKFSLPLYIGASFFISAIGVMLVRRVSPRKVIQAGMYSHRALYLVQGSVFAAAIITLYRAYQVGEITQVASLTTLSVLVNVLAAIIILKERDSIVKKVLAALVATVGVVLTV